MSNFDRIKAMNIDELAEFISQFADDCKFCICDLNDEKCKTFKFCSDGIKKWLESDTGAIL